MGFTNYPNGITSLGIPTFGAGGFIPPFTGKYFFVQEVTTAGVLAGLGTAQQPYNTLQQALARTVSGRNDVIFVTGTIHLTAPLVWSTNNVHLVGLCAPLKNGKRARISTSGSTPFGPLVSVTASGCIFQNFGTFFGFPTTGATSPVCWSDTGGRNCYNLVEFLGFGDATVTTGTANQTAARAFVLNTSTGEVTWRECVFGVNTVQRGAANYTVEFAGGAPRCSMIDCDFQADLAAGGTASSHIAIDAGGLDRELVLRRCRFQNSIKSGASAMAQVFNVNGAPGGAILMDQCEAFGGTAWETTPGGFVYANMQAISVPGGGISLVN